jgi:hypothetical protein
MPQAPAQPGRRTSTRAYAEKYFAQVPMPSPKPTKITLTIPAEQRDWLRDHPEIDILKLLQQAIRNLMMKDARKA